MLPVADFRRTAPAAKPASRMLASAGYVFIAGLLTFSLAPREVGDYWPWFVAGGSAAVVVSAMIVGAQLLRGRATSLQIGLFWTGVLLGVGAVLVACLAALPLVFAYTCCPGYYALGAWVVLYALGALVVVVDILYVPVAVLILETSTTPDWNTWLSIKSCLGAALVPALLSILLAPHHFQDIGGRIATLEAVATVGAAVVVAIAMLTVRPWPRLVARVALPGRVLAPAYAAVFLLVGYQSLVPPPDDPRIIAEATSASIKVFAPAGHPDLIREISRYQAAWDQLRTQNNAPDLTFDVIFDGLPPMRPHQEAVGEWEIKVKVTQTPESRLETFRQNVSDIIAYYRTIPTTAPR